MRSEISQMIQYSWEVFSDSQIWKVSVRTWWMETPCKYKADAEWWAGEQEEIPQEYQDTAKIKWVVNGWGQISRAVWHLPLKQCLHSNDWLTEWKWNFAPEVCRIGFTMQLKIQLIMFLVSFLFWIWLGNFMVQTPDSKALILSSVSIEITGSHCMKPVINPFMVKQLFQLRNVCVLSHVLGTV